MIVVNVFGRVVSELQETKTASGIGRVSFTVESADDGSLPIRHEVVSFGKITERVVKQIRLGTQGAFFGRLSAGGPAKRVTMTLSGFEVFEEAQQNGK